MLNLSSQTQEVSFRAVEPPLAPPARTGTTVAFGATGATEATGTTGSTNTAGTTIGTTGTTRSPGDLEMGVIPRKTFSNSLLKAFQLTLIFNAKSD